MKKNNKICICCDKVYTYCPNCHSISPTETWKNLWCSENCRNIFTIITDYNSKKISLDEARERLFKNDLNGYESFRPKIAEIIGSIINVVDQNVETTAEKVKENVDEVNNQNDKNEVVTPKKKYRRKFVNKIK